MLSWFLTKKELPTNKKQESIKRVQNMLLAPAVNTDKFVSPTLQQLKDIRKVQKLSSIYEDNITQENEKALHNRLALNTPLTSRKLMPSFKKKDDYANSVILDLLTNMLVKDKEYTDWMKKLMDSYVYELEFEARFMCEDGINNLVSSVFGNMKEIYEMHIRKFQPFIESCVEEKAQDISTQLFNFATKLIALCKSGTFYPYLLHSMIEKDATMKRKCYYVHLMRYAEQKYQFSYNFDPISQMTHYGLIIDEIFKEVHKQKVSLVCVEKMTYAVQEFKNEMAKIKSACIN